MLPLYYSSRVSFRAHKIDRISKLLVNKQNPFCICRLPRKSSFRLGIRDKCSATSWASTRPTCLSWGAAASDAWKGAWRHCQTLEAQIHHKVCTHSSIFDCTHSSKWEHIQSQKYELMMFTCLRAGNSSRSIVTFQELSSCVPDAGLIFFFFMVAYLTAECHRCTLNSEIWTLQIERRIEQALRSQYLDRAKNRWYLSWCTHEIFRL